MILLSVYSGFLVNIYKGPLEREVWRRPWFCIVLSGQTPVPVQCPIGFSGTLQEYGSVCTDEIAEPGPEYTGKTVTCSNAWNKLKKERNLCSLFLLAAITYSDRSVFFSNSWCPLNTTRRLTLCCENISQNHVQTNPVSTSQPDTLQIFPGCCCKRQPQRPVHMCLLSLKFQVISSARMGLPVII